MSGIDEVFSERQKQIKAFEFDERVTAVFPDMISRSVPGYGMILSIISMLTSKYAQEHTNCYDLGCSLGASTFAISEGLGIKKCDIVAVDNSDAMIKSFSEKLSRIETKNKISLINDSIENIEFEPLSVAVMNFTLQFIDPSKRTDLLCKLAEATKPGGILILSEKMQFESNMRDNHQIDLYHEFKRYNGYSDLEISQKRTALENVLRPESYEVHKERLIQAGYTRVDIWFQCFNFFSILAIK